MYIDSWKGKQEDGYGILELSNGVIWFSQKKTKIRKNTHYAKQKGKRKVANRDHEWQY